MADVGAGEVFCACYRAGIGSRGVFAKAAEWMGGDSGGFGHLREFLFILDAIHQS